MMVSDFIRTPWSLGSVNSASSLVSPSLGVIVTSYFCYSQFTNNEIWLLSSSITCVPISWIKFLGFPSWTLTDTIHYVPKYVYIGSWYIIHFILRVVVKTVGKPQSRKINLTTCRLVPGLFLQLGFDGYYWCEEHELGDFSFLLKRETM